jgi:hypothetical protein
MGRPEGVFSRWLEATVLSFFSFAILMLLAAPWFGAAGSSFEPQAPASQSAGAAPNVRLFPADERLTIAPPVHTVELARPLRLKLTFTTAGVSMIAVMQSDGDSLLTNQSAGVEIGSGEAKIVEDHGLTKTIEVIPLEVGTLQLTVMASFADGGLSKKTLDLHVEPGSMGVKSFHLDQGFSVIPLALEGNPEFRQHWMYPEVEYEQLDFPIKLKDSSAVTMVVEQPKDNPVIRVDSNGMVHGLRPGKARITGHFAGLEDTVVVDVRMTAVH